MFEEYKGTVKEKLILYFLNGLDEDYKIKNFTQKELSKKFKVGQPTISKSLKILLKEEIILLRNSSYYFNFKYIKS